jgi:hypothetical protein
LTASAPPSTQPARPVTATMTWLRSTSGSDYPPPGPMPDRTCGGDAGAPSRSVSAIRCADRGSTIIRRICPRNGRNQPEQLVTPLQSKRLCRKVYRVFAVTLKNRRSEIRWSRIRAPRIPLHRLFLANALRVADLLSKPIWVYLVVHQSSRTRLSTWEAEARFTPGCRVVEVMVPKRGEHGGGRPWAQVCSRIALRL